MLQGLQNPTTRRKWIGAAIGGGTLAATAGACGWYKSRHNAGGKFLGAVDFEDEGRAPLDTILGAELDGRLYTDLSHLEADRLTTPTGRFYLRTCASHLLDTRRPWAIRVTLPTGAALIKMDDLKAQARPLGLHLMECAGNTRAVRFGMIGVASWEGVPLAPLLDRMRLRADRILISGFDCYAAKPASPSVPGASWIFTRQDLENAAAFLATGMNGQPLTPDHGAPVRLVVPGWYGCACIKWVNEIAAAGDAAPPTSQMQEYAARTMQRGLPALAREYQPAVVDPAAMPVRIEKWLTDGKIKYHVAGIVWGGSQPADRLLIRFRPDEPYVPVSRIQPAAHGPWALWTHVWTPQQPGTYRIRLRLEDASIRTRRLDSGYYVRQVRIEQV